MTALHYLAKNRKGLWRKIVLTISLPLLSSCTDVKFEVTEGSSQQIAALCGIGDLASKSGPRITAPPPDQFVQPDILVEGTCEGSSPVEIKGGGLESALTAECLDGRFSQRITLKNGDGMKDLLVTQAGVQGEGRRCVMLDTTPPNIQITAPANLLTNNNTVLVTGICENGVPVEVTQDGRGAPITVNCEGGKFSARFPTSSGDGAKNLVATQKDPAGNSGRDDQQYIIDTVPPVVHIIEPVADALVKNSVTVRGTCEAGVPVTITGSATAAPLLTSCQSGEFTLSVPMVNRDGVHTVVAQQIDPAGNTGSDQRNIIRDTTAPLITITHPAAGTVAQTGVSLEGTCTDGLPVQLSGPGLAAPMTLNCNTGSFFAAITFSAGDGTKKIIASQTDAAGNIGSDSRDFIKDTTPPVVTIAAPAAGTATRSGITLTGTCLNGLMVNIAGAVVPAIANCVGGQFQALVTLTGADGIKNVIASQTDAAGNTGSDNRDFRLLTVGPVIRITAPAAGTASQLGLTLEGNCTNGLPVQSAVASRLRRRSTARAGRSRLRSSSAKGTAPRTSPPHRPISRAILVPTIVTLSKTRRRLS
ncbi:MAG: hypothetical protein HC902_12045 [Calothrix sp. SM1_5_4]|nr:hypothetical protein [Calothrix sp. SM1_5_4]